MNRGNDHPTQTMWFQWLEEGRPEDSPVFSHLEGCTSCARSLELYAELFRAHFSPQWLPPPNDIADRAWQVPRSPAPPKPRDPISLDWIAADVRGTTFEDVSAARVACTASMGVHVSIVTSPRVHDFRLQVRGTIWCEVPDRTFQVFLVHEDHVVAESLVRGGGSFLFDEPVPEGWTIEVHDSLGHTWEVQGTEVP